MSIEKIKKPNPNSKINPVSEIMKGLKNAGIDQVLHLPCGRIQPFLNEMINNFREIPLTREEDGVGIAAGSYMAGKKPVMIIQNSGIGNMVNALLSLTNFYELPLPIFISHRGIYKENIKAQIPMGEKLKPILEAVDAEILSYSNPKDVTDISAKLKECFTNKKIYAFLFSPRVWEGLTPVNVNRKLKPRTHQERIIKKIDSPGSRINAIKKLRFFLKDKAVVYNMGYPAREGFHVAPQDSNFYMLGSLGLASSIGLGVALGSEKDVVVIDGDGSLLMNPNALVSIGENMPKNLTIIAIDNGSYGSTGNQQTAAGRELALEELAFSCGIKKIMVTDDPGQVKKFALKKGTAFIRLVVKPGNAKVGIVDIEPTKIRDSFMEWLDRKG